MATVTISRRDGGVLAASFRAMASPCEVLLETEDEGLAAAMGELAANEAWRIERKFSRYRDDSVVSDINLSAGKPLNLDEETTALINFSARCYRISGGLFDITSGILRRVWHFDGSDRIPTAGEIASLLRHIGFAKVGWQDSTITLPRGMEIDLGGIAKEYAVDRVLGMLSRSYPMATLVNFGGDLATAGAPVAGPWRVAIENPGCSDHVDRVLELCKGALATSADTYRFLIRDGIRYGHVLSPVTGYPIPGAPRSVTVAAPSCLEAGALATMALLHGDAAAVFLDRLGVRYWCPDLSVR